jgi:thymidylate kinase
MLQSSITLPDAAPHSQAPLDGDKSGLIRDFLDTLEVRHVRYCHWKSNMRLREMLSGGDDIDLLVHREDASQLQAVMLEFGFKQANPKAGMEHPAVFHALSNDEARGQLVHLHVYHQIVSGDSLVKNYRLKVEDMLLSGTRYLEGVRVPRPEVELMLFLVRVALKHASLIELLMINRTYHSVSAELNWLRQQANLDLAAELCQRAFPKISSSLFIETLDVFSRASSLPRRLKLAVNIAWRMRDYRRMGAIRAIISRLHRVSELTIAKFQNRKGKILQSGGMVVALVGPKASGKSTLGNELSTRLGKQLLVRRIHAGKPPPTLLTMLPSLMIPVARKLLRSERSSEYQKTERRQTNNYSLIHVIHMLMLAYERRNLLRRSASAAAAGALVVSDRYPSATIGATDSSSFDDEAIASCKSRVKRWMMRQERKLYDSILLPDLVIRLEAPIALTTRRDSERIKPGGPDALALKRRWQLETVTKYGGVPEVVLHTDRSIEETSRDAVAAVWRRL